MATVDDGGQSLFSLTRKQRMESMAEMLDKHSMSTHGRVRFVLAGVVASVDSAALQRLARVMSEELKVLSTQVDD